MQTPPSPDAPIRSTADGRPRVSPAPWLIQQHFDGDVDLAAELTQRVPNMPLMSIIHFRSVGQATPIQLATLSTQDGAATLLVQVHAATRALELTFTQSSMLSLRFRFHDLSDLDREHWLTLLRNGDERPAFLWGAPRWDADYLIASVHRYFTNLFAFSPNQIEAAARVTPEVTRKLLDWLERLWDPSPESEPPRQEPPASFSW